MLAGEEDIQTAPYLHCFERVGDGNGSTGCYATSDEGTE